jgi:hypothetical protein
MDLVFATQFAGGLAVAMLIAVLLQGRLFWRDQIARLSSDGGSFEALTSVWVGNGRSVSFAPHETSAWTARPKSGTADVDPYSRASIARSGELPIGTGDGIAFSATSDDKRKPLDGRCDVVVSGVTPAARFWTLTLFDRKGHLVANSLKRYGFTSQEIIRGSDGTFEIRVASRSRAGNWLPTGGIERYALMLRLYDTPVGVATRTQRDAPMPSISTVNCP